MWRDSFFSMFCSVKLISWKELQPEELHQIVNLKMITMGKVLRMSVTTGSGSESNRKNKTSRINMTTRNNLENLKQKPLEWEQKNQESFLITDEYPHNQWQMNSHTVLLRGIYKKVSKVFGYVHLKRNLYDTTCRAPLSHLTDFVCDSILSLKKKMKSTCSLMRIMFRTGRRNDYKCWLVFQSICYLLNESQINYFIQCVQYMIQCLFQGLQYRKKTGWEQKLWWLFHWLRKYRPSREYPQNKQRTKIKHVFREKTKKLSFLLQWNSAN